MKKILAMLMVLMLAFMAFGALADAPGGTPPGDPPSGEMGGPGGTPPDGMPGGMGGPGGGSADVTYVAAVEITGADARTDETYSSDTADESALIVNTSEEVALVNPTVEKTGDSDGGDSCNFYGLNAALLAMGGGTVTIEGGTITSDADGANGVFSYGGNGGRTARRATAPPWSSPTRASPLPATAPAAS